MKKALLIAAIIGGCLFAVLIVARFTGALQYYRSPSSANAPALQPGDRFFASRFLKPQRLDFICFKIQTPEMGEHLRTYRLVGLEGDRIAIRSGVLYVNDQDVDAAINPNYQYLIAANDVDKLQKDESAYNEAFTLISADTANVYADQKTLRSKNIKARRLIRDVGEPDEYIRAVYGKNWNADHFGPYVVPPGMYFVMGDNRNAAQDSRYTGCINISDVIGTVIGKQ